MNNIDWTHNVLNGLDPALIEQASQSTKRRLPRPVRTVLVAACLCVALLGAAMATEELLKRADVQQYFSGSEFAEVMQKLDRMYRIVSDDEDKASGYVIPWEGSGISLEDMSAEMQKLLRGCTEPGKTESIRFSSAAEMQRFVGLTLYENEVLDQLEQRALAENSAEAVYDEDGNLLAPGSEVVGAVLNCINYENGTSRLDLMRFCALNNGALEIITTAELLSYDLERSASTAYVFVDGTQFSEEAYMTANGDEITIIRCEVPETAPYTQYMAHFHVHGVRYQVCIICTEDDEECGNLMKDILDAFVFSLS